VLSSLLSVEPECHYRLPFLPLRSPLVVATLHEFMESITHAGPVNSLPPAGVAKDGFQLEKLFQPSLTPLSAVVRLLEASKTTSEVNSRAINVDVAGSNPLSDKAPAPYFPRLRNRTTRTEYRSRFGRRRLRSHKG
jgi:hypothetical protein